MPESEKILSLVDFRHRLHRRPEIAGKEVETQALIRSQLAHLPVEVLPPYIGTDTVAVLRGKHAGPAVALRADIDALPVEEETSVAWKSEIPGMMHACGHDVHTAILLGAARLLAREDFAGSIRFIWQPGEEKKAMAKALVSAGVLAPAPDWIFALHVAPRLPFGQIACRPGAAAASSLHFAIEIKGQGGHGSMPDRARSPILPGAEIAQKLEILRQQEPEAMFSLGVFQSGNLDNVIPETAHLGGTLRTFTTHDCERIQKKIIAICTTVGAKYQVNVQFTPSADFYPPVINDRQAVELLRSIAGNDYLDAPIPSMSSEDFAYYLQHCRGAIFALGIGRHLPPLHNGTLLVPDEIIDRGSNLLRRLALTALRHHASAR